VNFRFSVTFSKSEEKE